MGASVSARRVVNGARDTGAMVKGTLAAESLRIGAVLEMDALTVSRIIRRDLAAPVTSAQPRVWTFVEFEGPDEIADTLARSLAGTPLREGGRNGTSPGGSAAVAVCFPIAHLVPRVMP